MKSINRTPDVALFATILAMTICGPSICVPSARACSVPVFRYALENWEPDRLTVAILHRGKYSEDLKKLSEQLDTAANESEDSVNLRLHPIDVEADHPKGSAEEHHASEWREKKLPQMLVYFSNDAPQPQLAWSAPLNQQNVDRLLQSPARKEVAERLLDGQSAVWILLKSGNKDADDQAERELKAELAKQTEQIELPSLTDLASEEKFSEDLAVEMRVEFSVIAIDPKDENEAFFREMLLNTESDLRDFEDPIAIPIYGRGRTYFALVGPGITSDNIADNCNFICGACSCEVKRDNPGQDLLLAANWNRVQPGNWVNDTPLPELTGIGGFEGLVDDQDTTDTPPTSKSEDAVASSSSEASIGNSSDPTLLASANHGGSTTQSVVEDQPTNAPGTNSVATNSAATNSTPASSTVAPMVLVWGAALFGIGLVFTIWQRSRQNG